MKVKNFIVYFITALMGATFALAGYMIFVKKDQIVVQPEVKTDTHFARFGNPLAKSTVPFNFTATAEQTVKGVVHVKTQSQGESNVNPFYEFFYGDRGQQPRPVMGFGSGVIISEDGYIVTNNHVIQGAEKIEVVLDDKRTFEAKLIGADPNTDLALLKVKAKKLPIIPMGNSEDVRLGQWVLAVGNPFNLTSTVTAGIVSAKGRNLGILGGSRYRIESFIQTDAALNRGNSGGALVDTDGMLIGITAAIVSATGDYSGNSFAIPVDIVNKIVGDLKEYGRVQRAILGVTIRDVTSELVEEKDLHKIEGVYIDDISKGGAAEAAGIENGDVVLDVNGVTVNAVSELQEQFSKYRPGDEVTVLVKRNNKTKQYDVILRNLEGGTDIVRTSDYVLGARFVEISEQELEELKISNGIKISEMKDGKLSDLGFKKDYIIVRINNSLIRSVSDINRISDTGEEINSIQGVRPDGMEFSLRIR
ncbi:MAG: trypsin-like peptidase domain-containing protein [Bacteroidales bacterium]|nr:trypsin-like peptidase domain-containing protein [Bacteroidales bacterium]